jgi:hypothetical protein
VTVYSSLTDTQQLTIDDEIAAEPALAGFRVPIRRFLSDPRHLSRQNSLYATGP